jgi:hypothetical protein
MNLKKLEAFIYVLEKRSFSEAAAALKSSQPSVSLKIKSLEESLGSNSLIEDLQSSSPLQPGALCIKLREKSCKDGDSWRMICTG